MGGYGSRVDENDVRDDGGFDDVSTSRKLCRFDRDSASVLCPLSKSSVWRDFSSTLRFELEGSQLSELYAGGGGYEGEDDEEDVVRSSSMSFDWVVKIAGRKKRTPRERRLGRTGVMGTSSRGLAIAETRFRTLLKASVMGLDPRPA